MNGLPPATDPRNRRLDLWMIGGAALVAAWLYFATAMGPLTPWFSRQPNGYYGLITAGLRSGHCYAAIAPHPGLLALKDPYDPVANAPYQVHDMSLYRGHYYLYFGVTPVLIAFWPCAALTGWYPTEALVVAVFATGAVWLAIALLWAVRCRYFPAASPVAFALGMSCLILANPVNRLVESPQFYQVAIAGAIFLEMGMLAALYRCLHSERRALGWLTLASALYGLAIGARPNYLPSGLAVLIAAVMLGRGGDPARRFQRWARTLAAAVGPAAVCGAGLMLYNWLRFDSPFEFGMRYALAGKSQLDFVFFDVAFMLPHLGHFLFGPGFWSETFPFFGGPAGQPYGFLRYDLWGWLAPLAFLRTPSSSGGKRGAAVSLMVAVAVLGNLLLLASFLGTNERYCCDFACAWLLLSGMGALSLSHRLALSGGKARVNRGLAGLAVIAMATCMSVFIRHAPSHVPLVALGRVANWPRYAWRRAHREQDGALLVNMLLEPPPRPHASPVFETGLNPSERDWLQIEPLAGDQARVSFHHTGMPGLTGQAFPVGADRRLAIEVRCGSLLPPFDSPAFSGWTEDEFATAKRELEVRINGVQRLRAVLECYDASPGDLRIGRLEWPADGVAQHFSGQVISVERLPLDPKAPALPGLKLPAPVELGLRLPAHHEAGGDPILVTGTGQQSDLLTCSYDGRGRIRFALDHFGNGGPQSDWIAYDAVKLHLLMVWMGSLAEPKIPHPISPVAGGPREVAANHRLFVRLDGQILLNGEQIFYPGSPATALIGANPYGSTTAGHRFEGDVEQVRQIGLEALPPLLVTGTYGRIELNLSFPENAYGTHEPLVVTGVSGAGDLVYASYLDPRHMAIALDHWGYGGLNGSPIEIDYAKPHRLSLTLGSLYPPGSGPDQSTLVRVTIDGRVALEGRMRCHPSDPSQIRIGSNPLGGSTCGPTFTGTISSIERAPVGEP